MTNFARLSIITVLSAIGCVGFSSVGATMSLGDYIVFKGQSVAKDKLQTYLMGVYKGALLFDKYAHMYLDRPTTTFCTDSVVWSENYPQLLLNKEIEAQASVRKQPYPKDIPVELVMFQAMLHNLRCK